MLRGHEYHYASITDAGDDAPLADLRDGLGRDLGPAGGRRGQVTGSLLPRHREAQEPPMITLDGLRDACLDLPRPDDAAADAVRGSARPC